MWNENNHFWMSFYKICDIKSLEMGTVYFYKQLQATVTVLSICYYLHIFKKSMAITQEWLE